MGVGPEEPVAEALQYTQVVFKRFKAFESFTLNLRHFNIMVGPNNAGKSTILAAFRILAAGLRKANTRKPVLVNGPNGLVSGYSVDLAELSIGEENIFFNYDQSEPALVTFSLTGDKKLVLYFPEAGSCFLIANDPQRMVRSPSAFKSAFHCPIGFVPILGPVEHNERLYEKEAARLALFNYRAARNFRNIWYHYPEDFEAFQSILRETWPGMDVEKPEINTSDEKPLLYMFCPEDRIAREIFWAGFGFQVWCQMLTHLVKSKNTSIFLIDEPDIYLHSDLQRQLLTLLENLGPDILIATHSTEIVSEAEADDIVLIDKSRRFAKRISDPSRLTEVFSSLGSNLNPILTQLAKTRRVVFVEGKDFQVFSKYARKLNLKDLGNRATFAVVPIEGFNPDRVRSLKKGIEVTLGGEVRAAVVLDRDFRSDVECDAIKVRCEEFCDLVVIHRCKEVESFLLVATAIDRAARRRVEERVRRTGAELEYLGECSKILEAFAEEKKSYVTSQFIASRRRFVRGSTPGVGEATTNQAALEEFDADWADGPRRRLDLVPAKDALSAINQHLQERYGVSVTTAGIIDATRVDEIPSGMRDLLGRLAEFAAG